MGTSGCKGGRPTYRAMIVTMVLVFLVAAAGIVLVVLAAVRNRRDPTDRP